MVTAGGWPAIWLPAVYVYSALNLKCIPELTQRSQMAGATSLLFVYSLDYARTRLANDAKNSKTGGERQFNGLVDVYKKTLASDGIAGLYRGFAPSVTGIIVYRGLYFGMYDSIKPVLLTGSLEDNFLASFLLGWAVTTGAGIASYPLDTIRRRMMMTSGEVSSVCRNRVCARANYHSPGRQVQGLPRCRPPDHRQGGCSLALQGCRCQHSPWCRRCRCALHLRPGPAAHVRQEVQGWIWLSASSTRHQFEEQTRSMAMPLRLQACCEI